MRLRWQIVLATLLGFISGFVVHRERLDRPVRFIGSYLTGRSGGCDLASALKGHNRLRRLDRSMDLSIQSVKMVGEASDGFGLWDTPLGRLWCPPKSSPAFAVGEQMAEVYTEGDMKLGPDDVVLDCGANVGDFVRTCLRAGVEKVVAIDPSPNNVKALERTFPEEIARGQVIVVPKGVWHEDSTMKMAVYSNSLLDSFVMLDRSENKGEPTPEMIELPVTTIDKIVEGLGLKKVTFLKMDIEGAERNAIRGAANTIARFRPRMALATENLEDDFVIVPQEVQKIAQHYDVRCGLCRFTGYMATRPDVLYFIPD